MIDLERFPDKQSFVRYQPRLQAEWERFVSGATAAPDSAVIPFRIAESWKRSRSYGLDPVHYQSYVRMKKLNLRTRERQIATNPVAAYWLGSLAKRYAFNVSIFDAQGNSIALLPGDSGDISFANEMVLGTNATALALLENRAGCVLAQEHYSRFFHQRFCLAAPFHAPEGNVAGAMCISTQDFEIVHSLAEMVEKLARMCTLIFALAHQNTGEEDSAYETILSRLAEAVAPPGTLAEGGELAAVKRALLEQTARAGDRRQRGGRLYLNEERLLAEPRGRQGEREAPVLSQPRPECSNEFADIVGSAPQLARCIHFAKQAALTDFSVVLNGESGVGKEVFAQAIHNASPRRQGPFVALNCGAIAASLVESELFGYQEGSFTGADRRGRAGLLEQASGGTLFLDEVESMPLPVQSKLLRVLSSGRLTRMGSTAELPVDLRVISASKVDLRLAAEQGRFREDLFYRISAVSLNIPPLRERREDIPQLARSILNRWGWGGIRMEPEVLAALQSYRWPGNVRELENTLIHACVFARGDRITLDSLPEELRSAGKRQSVTAFLREEGLVVPGHTATLEEIENAMIRRTLLEQQCVLSRAAQALSIDRKTLRAKIGRSPELTALMAQHGGPGTTA